MSSNELKKILAQKFGTWDYVVFGLMLAVSASIGLFYAFKGKKKQTTSDFLLGGRNMGVMPVAMSVLASFMSAVTLLGTPAEIYQFGTQYMVIVIGYCFLIPAAAYFYTPVFYNLGLTSGYEYLEKRFSKVIRSIASAAFSIQMLLYMSIVLYAPALALSQVTTLSTWGSVISIGVVCTFYTTVGGLKAVVWTDFFQIIMMGISMIVVVVKGAQDVGGWNKVWKINEEGERLDFFNFDVNPLTRHTIWSLSVGGYFTWLAIYGVNQAMVQRYLSLPTLKKAQKVIWINLPGLIFLAIITSMAGLVIYAKYATCDPLRNKDVDAPDQLFPLFVMDTLGGFPGLPGLFVSGIFSGALSTVSSGVNSLAAVTLEDIVKSFIKPDISEKWATRVTKILALMYGLIAIGLVYFAEMAGNVLQAALSLFGMIGGPLLGLFTLGMFFPWPNSWGAGVGFFSGLILSFSIGLGAMIMKPPNPMKPFRTDGCSYNYTEITTPLSSITAMYSSNMTLPTEAPYISEYFKVSYMWYSAIGCCTVVVVGLIVSFITGPKSPKDMDPKLFTPFFVKIFWYLPKPIRKYLRLGVKEPEVEEKMVDDKLFKINMNTRPYQNGAVNNSFVTDTKDGLYVTPL